MMTSQNWSEQPCADGFVEQPKATIFGYFWSKRRCADGFVETAVGHYFWLIFPLFSCFLTAIAKTA